MPYTYDNPPDYVKALPQGAQRICVDAFNDTYERTKDEDKARQACWGAIKNKYEQRGDSWVRKTKEGESMIDLGELGTIQKAYAAHNRLHAEYVDARWGPRRKAQIQEDHETVVKHIFALGGRHIPKGDSLDDTLPQELKEEMKLRYMVDGFALSEEAPFQSEIQVLRVGTFHHPLYGKFSITEEVLDSMVKNFKESRPKPPTEMVVDWEHLSTTEPAQKAKAAGWVKDLAKKDSSLFALVEWTEEAADEIQKREYRFISPEFTLNYKDKETGKGIGPTLLSVALTNRPFIEGMAPVVLSERLADNIFLEEVEPAEQELAEWTTKYINDLPDECFAYIKPGGEKDEEGKTVPRALRYLPYKDASGEVDPAHLRNALSRLSQTDLSPEEQAKARGVLVDAARKAEIGEYAEGEEIKSRKEKSTLMEEKLRELLGLDESADVLEAVKALKEKPDQTAQVEELQGNLAAAESRAQDAEKKLTENERDRALDEAIQSGKLTPKMRDWAGEYYLKDPEGFKTYLESAEHVGPDLTIKGGDGEKSIQLTELELAIAEKLGVDPEILSKFKEEDSK